MRRLVAIGAIVFAAMGASVLAITYGYPDGNRHPNVGALVGEFTSGTFPYCSGTLISPTVFLTAAHCDIGRARVAVMFESEYSARAKLHAGTFDRDPRYTWRQNDPHDIAVVVFDRPVKDIAPARLPSAGQLEGLTQADQFTVVGYGGQETVNAPGGHVIAYYDIREYAIASFSALNGAWLRLSQNPATDDGGACYGDSGGPNFLGAGATETNIVAGTTITGDVFCKATNVTYRLDTEAARSFLGRFVELP
jgi:secreted trypsin-like serine protease